MCGIFFYEQNTPISPEKSEEIFKAIALLTHRGPEALKCELVNPYTVIGFTFLPIMTGSETKGLQPFRYDDGWILLCNGEIYNHQIFLKKGSMQSDVEYIYYAFKKYGPSEFLDHINGEFAFILYNSNTKELFARRDAYGIRAFHKAVSPNAIGYASEMKALYPLFKPEEISHVTPLKNTFSTPALTGKYDPINKLSDAVYRRLSSVNIKRPYAFLLSGGLDSSIICAIASTFVDNICTFCLSIGDEDGTDLQFARKFADLYKDKITHVEVRVSVEDAINAIPDVIKTVETFDVTTIRASVGQYLVCKYIKQHHPEICALIVGEGADELFGGYAYSVNSPSNEALVEDSQRLLSELYRYDCKRVDMCVSRFGMEARPPFLDLKFAAYMEADPNRFQFDNMKSTGLTKTILREKFGHLLPPELVERKKEAFSDGVMAHTHRGNSWYGAIQDHAAKLGFTEKEWYKFIFDKYYKGCDHLVPKYWMPQWTNNTDDPSALVYMA